MLWYNILGLNKVRISHTLHPDTITAGYILLTNNLVALKRNNYDPILIVKRTEWRKLIDSFGLSIEAGPYRVVKNNSYFFRIEYTKPFICKAQYIKAPKNNMDKYFNF